jgi:hypothetical protein
MLTEQFWAPKVILPLSTGELRPAFALAGGPDLTAAGSNRCAILVRQSPSGYGYGRSETDLWTWSARVGGDQRRGSIPPRSRPPMTCT